MELPLDGDALFAVHFRGRAHESTLDAELNDFGAQPAMLGGYAADSDGQAEAARSGTARIEKEYAVLCLDLGLVGMTIDHSVDVVGGPGVKLGQNVYHINAEAIDLNPLHHR